MRPDTIEKRLKILVKEIRKGEWDDPDVDIRFYRPSFLIDADPPKSINWNYLNGKNWSQKWLISISLGPWREGRARYVMEKVQKSLGSKKLSSLVKSQRLPFPLLPGDWQWKWTIRLAEYLRNNKISETKFFNYLINLEGGGLEARGVLRAICDARGPSKTIDYFVREALDLSVIPVDRHVWRILKKYGLGNALQEELLAACQRINIRPQRLARALFISGA